MNDPLLAYVGPETLLPLGTVLAATVGIVLTFGRATVTLMKKCVSAFTKK
jgi:hypothetical protein